MNQESGGNERAINNWDSNAAQGQDMKSKGLMQVIGPTFRAHREPGYSGDIYDPLSNLLASMNYALDRYGSLPRAYNRKGGYAKGSTAGDFGGRTPTLFDGGGWLTDDMLAVHRLPTPDAVIPADEMRVIRKAATREPVVAGAGGGDTWNVYAPVGDAERIVDRGISRRQQRDAIYARRR